MSKAPASFEVPAEMRNAAEKSVEQARKAVDGVINAARRTTEQMESTADKARASVADTTHRSFSYAEQNIAAAFDLAQRIVRAKSPQEAAQIQAQYVRQQFEVLQSQMKEFGGQQTGAKSQS